MPPKYKHLYVYFLFNISQLGRGEVLGNGTSYYVGSFQTYIYLKSSIEL